MIMSMYNIIAVTNRHLCCGDFFRQLERLAQSPIRAVLLREKDLSLAEYKEMAGQALAICRRHGKKMILHGFVEAAADIKADALHITFAQLQELSQRPDNVQQLGVSVHSLSEALAAQRLGADYLIVGHVFATACKRGVPPRGLAFLRQLCAGTALPVYAIGGMSLARLPLVLAQGAAGICMMSECMKVQSALFRQKI